MERIKKKLHSQSGASFLLALLAFLVAAAVSVLIVTAAVTNVKRIYSDREAQQDHLTLLSAAQLVRDEMKKTEYEKVTVTSSDSSDNRETGSPKGTFGAEMQDAVEAVKKYSEEFSTAFKVEVDGLDDMKAVKVSFTMQPEQYGIVFKLSIDNSDETLSVKDSGETLFLIMSGNKKEVTTVTYTEKTIGESETETIETKTVTETYTWKSGIINAIGDTAGDTAGDATGDTTGGTNE